MLEVQGLAATPASGAQHRFVTTGAGREFAAALVQLTGAQGDVTEMCWQEERAVVATSASRLHLGRAESA
jgi:hypothetical protein